MGDHPISRLTTDPRAASASRAFLVRQVGDELVPGELVDILHLPAQDSQHASGSGLVGGRASLHKEDLEDTT